jgi:hypothetical protein
MISLDIALTDSFRGKTIRAIYAVNEVCGWREGNMRIEFEDNTTLEIELAGSGEVAIRVDAGEVHSRKR